MLVDAELIRVRSIMLDWKPYRPVDPGVAKHSNKARPARQSKSEPVVFRATRYAPWVAALFVVVASVRITATYGELSRTGDEQAHIACGMEYLDKGTYTYEPQHPPLTRMMAALLPYENGAHSWGMQSMWYEGGAVLYRSGNYEHILELARTGMLPFFWLGCAVVFLWCRRYFDPITTVIAVAIFSFTPTVLAHAGLATTDIGLAALYGASLLTTLVMVERPSLWTGAIFGLTLGLAICSKFSFLVFYPSSLLLGFVAYVVLSRPHLRQIIANLRSLISPAAIGVMIALLTVWAVYRFSFGKSALTGALSVPFPELFQGINQVIEHDVKGHPAYLLGRISQKGFWYYYPVALFFKLPIPLMALIGLGIAQGWRQYRLATSLMVAFALGILAVGAGSSINIGVRHVLPLFLFFSILAALGVRTIFSPGAGVLPGSWRYRAIAALLIWFGIESLWAHPDYLAYFNELALGHPERIVVDSDLDWQQDFKRAAKRLHELDAQTVAFHPYNVFTEDLRDFPQLINFDPVHPVPGWNLVGITSWKAIRYGLPSDTPLWMDHVKPLERIGQGMLLFHIEDSSRSANDSTPGR
jgi:hypothetical protein